jgi:hypothetical protein
MSNLANLPGCPLLQDLDRGQLPTFEEFEERLAAGRDVRHFVRDAELRNGG